MSRDYSRYTASQTQAIRPALPALCFSCLLAACHRSKPSLVFRLAHSAFFLSLALPSLLPLSLSLYSLVSFQYRHCLVEAIESAPSRYSHSANTGLSPVDPYLPLDTYLRNVSDLSPLARPRATLVFDRWISLLLPEIIRLSLSTFPSLSMWIMPCLPSADETLTVADSPRPFDSPGTSRHILPVFLPSRGQCLSLPGFISQGHWNSDNSPSFLLSLTAAW